MGANEINSASKSNPPDMGINAYPPHRDVVQDNVDNRKTAKVVQRNDSTQSDATAADDKTKATSQPLFDKIKDLFQKIDPRKHPKITEITDLFGKINAQNHPAIKASFQKLNVVMMAVELAFNKAIFRAIPGNKFNPSLENFINAHEDYDKRVPPTAAKDGGVNKVPKEEPKETSPSEHTWVKGKKPDNKEASPSAEHTWVKGKKPDNKEASPSEHTWVKGKKPDNKEASPSAEHTWVKGKKPDNKEASPSEHTWVKGKKPDNKEAIPSEHTWVKGKKPDNKEASSSEKTMEETSEKSPWTEGKKPENQRANSSEQVMEAHKQKEDSITNSPQASKENVDSDDDPATKKVRFQDTPHIIDEYESQNEQKETLKHIDALIGSEEGKYSARKDAGSKVTLLQERILILGGYIKGDKFELKINEINLKDKNYTSSKEKIISDNKTRNDHLKTNIEDKKKCELELDNIENAFKNNKIGSKFTDEELKTMSKLLKHIKDIENDPNKSDRSKLKKAIDDLKNHLNLFEENSIKRKNQLQPPENPFKPLPDNQ